MVMVRQEIVNAALAEILTEMGKPASGEARFDGMPDVFALIRGIRVIIEGWFEGSEAGMEDRLDERLEAGLCELAVSIVYPRTVAASEGLSPPTPQQVKQKLYSSKVKVLAKGIAGMLFKGETIVSQLVELLQSLASQTIPENELDEAVREVHETIADFTNKLGVLPKSQKIAEAVGELLGLGEG